MTTTGRTEFKLSQHKIDELARSFSGQQAPTSPTTETPTSSKTEEAPKRGFFRRWGWWIVGAAAFAAFSYYSYKNWNE